MWVTGGDGGLRQESYADTMQLFEPILEAFLDLYISFNCRYFRGETSNWEDGSLCLKFRICYETLDAFLRELKAEYETFKLQMPEG